MTLMQENKFKGSERSVGFTLIEMMIVLAVIAILASMALPAFNDFIARTKMRSGTAGLSAYRGVLEQAYQDNRSYRTDDNLACLIATYPVDYFALTCVATSDTTYVLTATSLVDGGLGSAGDYVFTIDQDGTPGTSRFKGEAVTVAYWKYK